MQLKREGCICYLKKLYRCLRSFCLGPQLSIDKPHPTNPSPGPGLKLYWISSSMHHCSWGKYDINIGPINLYLQVKNGKVIIYLSKHIIIITIGLSSTMKRCYATKTASRWLVYIYDLIQCVVGRYWSAPYCGEVNLSCKIASGNIPSCRNLSPHWQLCSFGGLLVMKFNMGAFFHGTSCCFDRQGNSEQRRQLRGPRACSW